MHEYINRNSEIVQYIQTNKLLHDIQTEILQYNFYKLKYNFYKLQNVVRLLFQLLPAALVKKKSDQYFTEYFSFYSCMYHVCLKQNQNFCKIVKLQEIS